MIRGVQDTENRRPQVERERSAAAAMLGLPGFVVLAVSDDDGEVEQAIETTADVVGCPECGAVAELHDRRPCWIRDLPTAGRPVMLVWVKRVWRCRHAWCPKRTWTETSRWIAPRASLTERARAEICRRVGEEGCSVAAVAREFGIGWRTAMEAVREHGIPRVEDPARLAGVDVLGLDETAFQAASATRTTSFVTGIVDLTDRRGPATIARRGRRPLRVGAAELGEPARAGVAGPDHHRGAGPVPRLRSALRTALPHAVRVLDAFHVVRLGFAALDEVRRRIPQQLIGHRGRRDDPLFGIRRLLRRGYEHHSAKSWARLLAGLDAGDTADEQLARTWVAAQDLRLIFSAPDRARAAQALYRRLVYCADAAIPELTRLARTIDSWRTELLAYFDTGVSNGPTEAINLLIKKIKRVGHGFRNFANYRLRLLLHCGVDWNTVRATPIRGRLPRLVA
jgi:transposase